MPSGFGEPHTIDGGSQNGKTARFKNTPQKAKTKTPPKNKKKTNQTKKYIYISAVSSAL